MKTVLKGLLFANLILLDLFAFYLVYDRFFTQNEVVQTAEPTNMGGDILITPEALRDECGESCKAYIESAVTDAISGLSGTTIPIPTQSTKLPVAAPRDKVKSVNYVPIPGSGSTKENNWTDISGTEFYLSKSDYPGLTEVYLEINMKLFNGNGLAYVQLYDATHGVGVAGSEVSTASQNSTFVSSGKISLWEGYNLYRIQAKSLTADTTVFESGRLKVITEN